MTHPELFLQNFVFLKKKKNSTHSFSCRNDIVIENQQKHQSYRFIVMLSQTLLHVSAHQRHRHGAHIILTSYLYVSVHYRKNIGISSEVAPIITFTLWIISGYDQPLLPATVNHIHLYP
jgi:hypothetical protein